MKIDIITLFPNMFTGFVNESIMSRDIKKGIVEINVVNLRDYSTLKNKRVDDYPYGGGEGMVLMPDPVFRAVDDLKTDDSVVLLMTPQGIPYKQKMAYNLTNNKHIIIICGHYEGFDERIRSLADYEISIGDYVLTGCELASMVVTDSIVILLDGVIKTDLDINDSFNNDLLDYPNYTHPEEYRGMKVPEVLLSGHHENIKKWRLNEQIKRTKIRRPDLIKEDI